VYDPELIRQVPESVTVHRAWTLEPPFRFRKKVWKGLGAPQGERTVSGGLKRRIARLLCPDPQVLWYPFAIREAAKIVERHAIEAVIVTAPPFSAFLIGNALKAAYPHLRLISEFRDEWLCYYVNEFAFRGDEYIRRRSAEIERATVTASDRIVAVTQATLETIRSRYPEQPDSKFVLAPNGYDPETFARFTPRPHNTGKIVVTYTGTVYKPSSPAAYLDALDRLPEELRGRFETRFIGRVADEYDRGIFENRKSAVKLTGFVPQEEAIRQMEETDYLLLPWSDHLNVPGKLYEYLAARKPILGLVRPGSDAERVLRQAGTARLADGGDVTAIQPLLEWIAQQPDASYGLRPDANAIRRYERPRLAAEYANCIRECVYGAAELAC